MNIDCEAESQKLLDAGDINKFCKDYLVRVCMDGVNRELWEEAVDDMKVASSLGVSSEEDFKLFFYIDHFVEDLSQEIFGLRLSEEEENDLKKHMFALRDEIAYDDLLSFRVAILKWVKSKGKKVSEAVWNTKNRNMDGGGAYYLKRHNLEFWSSLVELVRKAMVYGIPKEVALAEAADQLDNTEKYDFLSWYNFKYGREKELYDLNAEIREQSRGNLNVTKNANFTNDIFDDGHAYYLPQFKREEPPRPAPQPKALPVQDEQDVQDFSAARSKMVSRTFSLDKLLEKYKHVLDADQIEEIEDAINNLRKKIRKLKRASVIDDAFHKTAAIFKKNNWEAGSNLLTSLNQPITKVAINEATSEDLEKLLDKLYGISDSLKRRDLVRKIAEVDLALYEMNIAGFFPELTDAQSKLIDAFAYASNKIQDVIPKLRSGVSQGGGVDIQLHTEDESDLPLAAPPVAKPKAPRSGKTKELADEVSELAKAVEAPIKE